MTLYFKTTQQFQIWYFEGMLYYISTEEYLYIYIYIYIYPVRYVRVNLLALVCGVRQAAPPLFELAGAKFTPGMCELCKCH